jgi:hypothetical protein
MNIVVVGGGRFGQFGNDFVRRAKSEGHTVRVLSHRTTDDTDATLTFLTAEDAVTKFNVVTQNLNDIDILLYNSAYKGYPDDPSLFTSKGVIKEKLYVHGFYVQAIIPHALSIEALKKMSSQSKIVFMTTDVIYDRERTVGLHKLGYYGGKAYQHQLMLALAEHNDKGISVSSISPMFDYEDRKLYSKQFDTVYAHIFGPTRNGKVYDCWE